MIPLRSQLQPIGLDIGRDGVRMMQLEVVNDSLHLRAAASERFAAGAGDPGSEPQARLASALEIVRRMLKRHPFAGRRVVAALPREIVQVKNIRLPLIPADELGPVVQFEARNLFAFDTSEAVVRHLPAGEVRQGNETRQEVIVLAARNAEVDHLVEQLHHGGLVVDSLDVEPCALYRSVERFIRRRDDEQEVHVLIDVGTHRSAVVIGRGRNISFCKPIEIGAEHLHEAVSVSLGIGMDDARSLWRRFMEIDPQAAGANGDPVHQAVFDACRGVMEALSREISLCLRYYSVTFRGHRPMRLRLLGGQGNSRPLRWLLGSALGVEVEAAHPWCAIQGGRMPAEVRRGLGCEWALAMGLALKRTRGNFGTLEGTPRDPAGSAEVIDLSSEVSAHEPAGSEFRVQPARSDLNPEPRTLNPVTNEGEAVHA